jgi:hypothetical protein
MYKRESRAATSTIMGQVGVLPWQAHNEGGQASSMEQEALLTFPATINMERNN